MSEPGVPAATDEGLREAIAALKPASNLQGSPVNAYCMARDAALALIDAARTGEGLDVERLLRIEAAALAFVAAEKAWTDSRLDTALGSVADEAAAALRAALHPDTAEDLFVVCGIGGCDFAVESGEGRTMALHQSEDHPDTATGAPDHE